MNRAITGLAGPQSRSVLLLSIVTVALTGPTTALAFDCRKASTLTEKAICADPELKRKDNQLSRDYALFRQHFSKSGNYDCLVADEKKRQLDWLKERDACGADKACIAAAYDKRQSELDLFTRACFPMDSMRPECKKGAPTAPVTSPVASTSSPTKPDTCSDSIDTVPESAIRAALPRAPGTLVNKLTAEINFILKDSHASQINSKQKLAFFLGQVDVESGGGTTLSENLNYSADALKKIFSYFKKHPDEANMYGRTKDHPANQEAIANRAYAKRNGNGDIASGDGWVYRGRGLLQVTGRGNYSEASSRVNTVFVGSVDYVKNPELLRKPEGASRSVLAYWIDRGIGSVVDGLVKQGKTLSEINYAVTGLVNGSARHALVDRLNSTRRILGTEFYKLCKQMAEVSIELMKWIGLETRNV
ncbi:hypothetical protein A5904_13275 [Acidithiobacillus caldus]|uniref:Chinitase domain protein n=1 Tax=Acidithiobacillus caldus (strain SM-1) TaxID=990288 RepID=F9ZTP3_ACICS|nr:chinitase domain-containing protein [Acidithiobacillus caldus]AEK59390.1 Chinitase domain protein [Acidithiobacillus caldus SM-1]AUW33763.1 hypothetical protein A5904_13275 [Acidithiobacillus caldus]QER44282.1 hypothetical protein F0726_01208 [Acidithiobacillus caldus]